MGQARPTPPPSRFPIYISIVSLSISIVGFLLTFHIFTLTHRPYIGNVDSHVSFSGNPPTFMQWSFTTRNTGSVPAFVTVKEHRVVVTTDGVSNTIPRAEVFGIDAVTIFMPQQTVPIPGHVGDDGKHVKVVDILSGRTTLNVYMEFSYKPTNKGFLGWLSNTYTYRSTWRFFHGPEYGFGMIEPAYAD